MPLIYPMDRMPKPSSGSSIPRDKIISIQFDKDKLRARKVVSRSNAKATGKWPSWKIGRMVHYESGNERNAFKLLDACPEVIRYGEQPCVILYALDGEMHRHFPDILVDFGSHKELGEVKTAEESRRPEVVRRTALMTECLPAFGYVYRLVIAEDLAHNPRLDNINSLLRHGRQPVPLVEREKIRQMFSQASLLPWGFFRPGEPGEAYRRHVCRLILEGVLAIDINRPWESSTAVIWNSDSKGDASWV